MSQLAPGRVLASNGYILVRVGTGHHLADVRGYAYEHRLVAEESIGRRLLPGEIVHHENGIKSDNRPENLRVVANNAEHFVHHRKRSDLRLPGEDNPHVSCACGCGTVFRLYDDAGRPREYVSGHNPPPSHTRDAVIEVLRDGSMRRKDMAETTGIPARRLAQSLCRLKKSGRVIQVSHGVWALLGEGQDGRELED